MDSEEPPVLFILGFYSVFWVLTICVCVCVWMVERYEEAK